MVEYFHAKRLKGGESATAEPESIASEPGLDRIKVETESIDDGIEGSRSRSITPKVESDEDMALSEIDEY